MQTSRVNGLTSGVFAFLVPASCLNQKGSDTRRDNTTFPVADYYPHLPVFVTKTPGAGKSVNYYSYAPAGPEWEFPLADAEQSWRIETCLKLWLPTVFNTPNKV
ncbi:hypothetical protein ED202_23155 [Escherichia coli]|nr:hypothetical protein [Salmonella enterica]EEV5958367.1 hypothetical protein [Escherichia coli]EEW1031598.1 hypothetical protein [Escherichia coli]EEW1721321.1 hypothetical protein [Escherichia coli]EFA4926207.1 hypothetical protein [Escherichia coli]